jgi:hypothetical protein
MMIDDAPLGPRADPNDEHDEMIIINAFRK